MSICIDCIGINVHQFRPDSISIVNAAAIWHLADRIGNQFTVIHAAERRVGQSLDYVRGMRRRSPAGAELAAKEATLREMMNGQE